MLPAARELFPFNPYPHAERSVTGATPFSEAEGARVCKALKADLVAVFKGGNDLSETDQLTVLCAGYLPANGTQSYADVRPCPRGDRTTPSEGHMESVAND
jgi:hypothetical protein